ncbi:hypothetical protein LCGC14_0164860 [marine sediment metagenome]|uniref:Uncharacterized protein n=1 Tax=marine sediment metagenome TaxID=412755 RepID=A0A0F9VAR8_9ZZZZ
MPVFPLDLSSTPYAVRIDQVDSNTSYIGKAEPGSGEAAGVWQIQRITVSGTITSIEWAGGTDEFDKVWDDRVGLTYS